MSMIYSLRKDITENIWWCDRMFYNYFRVAFHQSYIHQKLIFADMIQTFSLGSIFWWDAGWHQSANTIILNVKKKKKKKEKKDARTSFIFNNKRIKKSDTFICWVMLK